MEEKDSHNHFYKSYKVIFNISNNENNVIAIKNLDFGLQSKVVNVIKNKINII